VLEKNKNRLNKLHDEIRYLEIDIDENINFLSKFNHELTNYMCGDAVDIIIGYLYQYNDIEYIYNYDNWHEDNLKGLINGINTRYCKYVKGNLNITFNYIGDNKHIDECHGYKFILYEFIVEDDKNIICYLIISNNKYVTAICDEIDKRLIIPIINIIKYRGMINWHSSSERKLVEDDMNIKIIEFG